VPVILNSKAALEKVYSSFINAYFLRSGNQNPDVEAINSLLYEVEKLFDM